MQHNFKIILISFFCTTLILSGIANRDNLKSMLDKSINPFDNIKTFAECFSDSSGNNDCITDNFCTAPNTPSTLTISTNGNDINSQGSYQIEIHNSTDSNQTFLVGNYPMNFDPNFVGSYGGSYPAYVAYAPYLSPDLPEGVVDQIEKYSVPELGLKTTITTNKPNTAPIITLDSNPITSGNAMVSASYSDVDSNLLNMSFELSQDSSFSTIDQSFVYDLNATPSVQNQDHTFTGLNQNTTYYWRVVTTENTNAFCEGFNNEIPADLNVIISSSNILGDAPAECNISSSSSSQLNSSDLSNSSNQPSPDPIPNVFIYQKSGLEDPSNSVPTVYTAKFSKPINTSTFTTSDVSTFSPHFTPNQITSFRAPDISVDSITEVAPFDGTKFDISVSASGPGLISISIPESTLYTSDYFAGVSTSLPNSNYSTRLVSMVTDSFKNIFSLYIDDYYQGYIYKTTPSGVQTLVTQFSDGVGQMTIDSSDNLYVSKNGNISKVTPAGVVTTLGSWSALYNVDANNDIKVDSTGVIYVTDNNKVIKTTPGGVSTIIEQSPSVSYSRLALDSLDNLYVSTSSPNDIIKITPSGTTTSFATDMDDVTSVVMDSNDNLYVSILSQNYSGNKPKIVKIDQFGNKTDFAINTTKIREMKIGPNNQLYALSKENKNHILKFDTNGSKTYIQLPGYYEEIYTFTVDKDNSDIFSPYFYGFNHLTDNGLLKSTLSPTSGVLDLEGNSNYPSGVLYGYEPAVVLDQSSSSQSSSSDSSQSSQNSCSSSSSSEVSSSSSSESSLSSSLSSSSEAESFNTSSSQESSSLISSLDSSIVTESSVISSSISSESSSSISLSSDSSILSSIVSSSIVSSSQISQSSLSPSSNSSVTKSSTVSSAPNSSLSSITIVQSSTNTQTSSLEPESDPIDTNIEDQGANGGDGNFDGILDSLQNKVTSFKINKTGVNPIGDDFTIQVENTECPKLATLAELVQAGKNYIEFRAICTNTLIKAFWYGLDPTKTYTMGKYNPSNGVSTTFESAVISVENINGRDVVVSTHNIQDNGLGDFDTISDRIYDPFTLIANTTPVPTPNQLKIVELPKSVSQNSSSSQVSVVANNPKITPKPILENVKIEDQSNKPLLTTRTGAADLKTNFNSQIAILLLLSLVFGFISPKTSSYYKNI